MRNTARCFSSVFVLTAIAAIAASGISSTAHAQDAPRIGADWEDSTPEAEYDETLAKARSLLAALGVTI